MTDFITRRGAALKHMLASAGLLLCALLLMSFTAPVAEAQTASLNKTAVNQPEGNSGSLKINFQIQLSSSPSVPVTVGYATADGSAKAGEDYIGASGTVTFAVGQTLKSVDVDVLGDTLFEDNEDFSFSLTSVSPGTLSTTSRKATIIIQNDDAQPNLSIDDAFPVAEGDPPSTPTALFTVSLNQPSGKSVTVNYNTADISATNADYTPINLTDTPKPTLTFAPGETQKTIAVSITADDEDETTEYFKVQLTSPIGASLTRTEALGTITDDDGPSVSFLGDATVSENDAVATLFVTLSAPSPEVVTVNYYTNDNSAVAGADYQATSGMLVFSPGETTKALTVPLVDDNIKDNNKFFTVDLFGASAGVSILDSQAIVFIIDNEGQPTLTISPSSTIEGTGSGNVASFDVVLTPTSTQTVTVSYKSEEDPSLADPNERALAEVDFRSVTGSLTFAPGETLKKISVPLIGDSAPELDEKFKVTLSNNVNATFASGSGGTLTNSAVGTILDDDLPTVSVTGGAAVNEGNSGTKTVDFQVSLSVATPKKVIVSYATADGTATVADNDYGATSGTLTFDPNTTAAKTVKVVINGDTKYESDETFSMDLSSPSNAVLSATNASATQVITNDDNTKPLLKVSGVSKVEGTDPKSTSFQFQFTLQDSNGNLITSGLPVDIAVATTDGTATAPSDYTAVTTVLTIPAGSSSATLTVPVIADALFEDDETFTLNYSADPAVVDVGVQTSVQGIIVNDDQANKPTVSIPSDPPVVDEKDVVYSNDLTQLAKVDFPVSLDQVSGKDVKVQLTLKDGVDGTEVNGAKATSDYLLFASQAGDSVGNNRSLDITIPAGQTTVLQSIYINGDTLNEKLERFEVLLTLKDGSAKLGNANTKIRINDNDKGGTVTIKGDPVSLFENPRSGPSQATFDVTLSAISGQDLVFGYSILGTTANPASAADLKGGAFGSSLGTFTIPAGQLSGSFSVTVNDDDIDEKQESFILKLQSVSDPTWTLPTAGITCTITDDDPGLDPKTPFTPDKGYAPYSNLAGTQVTIAGNDLVVPDVNQQPQVARVFFTHFGDTTRPTLEATKVIGTPTATSLTVEVPVGALTGPIRVLGASGGIITTKSFIVQPTIYTFTPNRGVAGVSSIRITGANLASNLNPVTGVAFASTNATPVIQNSIDLTSLGQGQGEITCVVPKNATSGKLALISQFGGQGPDSANSFTVDTVTPGTIDLDHNGAAAVIEGDNVVTPSTASSVFGLNSYVQRFSLEVNPALGTATQTQVPPTGNVTIELKVVAAPTFNLNGTLPELAVLASTNPSNPNYLRVTRGSTITYTLPAGEVPPATVPVYLVNAGDDDLKGDATLTISARISRTTDPTNYPTSAAANTISVKRVDQHGIRVTPNTLVTSETDVAPDPTASDFLARNANFELTLHNASIREPGTTSDGRELLETVPANGGSVVMTVSSPDTTEGLVSYFLLNRSTGQFYTGPTDGQPIPAQSVQVIFSSDPTSPNYYLNPHYVVVTGQDDNVADNDQRYTVTVSNVVSDDPEYNGITIDSGVIVVNRDNEQGTTGRGFIYSPSNGTDGAPVLNTNESGTTDSFTVALRSIPSGPVNLKLVSTNPSVVKLIDPATQGLKDEITVTFYRNSNNFPNGFPAGSTRWDIPIRISVQGQDDGIDQSAAAGNDPQTVVIKATASSDSDATYNGIDPFDPIVRSTDNQTAGFLVTPTTIVINEAESDTFAVRLGSRPTQNVTVNIVSSNKLVATANVTRLVFTPTTNQPLSVSGTTITGGWNITHNVIVTGVDDGAPLGDRTATIQLTAASGDSTYNVDPADVNVQVLDRDSATFSVSPATVTVQEGETGSFQVKLNGKPSANVVTTFASNNASKVRLLLGGKQVDTVTLTFTTVNYGTFQTVSFASITDDDANNDTASIVSSVTSADSNYQTATPPQAQIIVNDTSGNNGGTGGTTTFEPNTTYAISFPFMPNNSSTEEGTPNQIFSLPLKTNGVANYRIYAFAAKRQDGSLLPVGSEVGSFPFAGYTEVEQGQILSRGRGYILINGSKSLSLKLPAGGRVFASQATTYTFNLARNTSGVTGGNGRNGLNLIGFPFDPAQYQYVDLAKATVVANGFTYDTVEKAAAAGVMSPDLYECLPSGKLSKVSQEQRYLKPYKAYFVQIFQDNVVLTLKNPNPVPGG